VTSVSALADFPLVFLPVSFGVLALCTWLGTVAGRRHRAGDDGREALGVVLTATLTLLGLTIGFAFSMAVARFDQRKSYEEAEANAIGTEYARAGLLSAAQADGTRKLLEAYLHQRILFYETRDPGRLRQIDAETARLHKQLWSSVETPAHAPRDSPLMGLVLAGMNDVLNSQSYTQASWWNRIPMEAWELLMVIAMVGTAVFGYTARGLRGPVVRTILAFIVSLAFFLIADIDSPRHGLVSVAPENLRALARSYARSAAAEVSPAPDTP
jgi:hypothetical protein